MSVLDSSAELVGLPPRTLGDVVRRVSSADFEAWERQVRRIGGCSHPIKLRGQTVDARTGEVTYDTANEPDGILQKGCGNRRASVCPSCSWLYRGDTWQVLNAGMVGGHGVPPTVATHPMVFATLTAPSFGAVHTAQDSKGGLCHPEHEGKLCPHGRPRWCRSRHRDGDVELGQPLCSDCYRYDDAVLFNWWAPELWRRFTITLRRHLRRHVGLTEERFNQYVRLSFAKVAEFQRRGAVHFHAIVRLDAGKAAGDTVARPLVDLDGEDLAAAVRSAARAFTLTVDAPHGPVALRFGWQTDAQSLTSYGSETVSPELVAKHAAYLSKYTTKGAEDFGITGKPSRRHLRRLPGQTVRAEGASPHVVRLVDTCNRLAATLPAAADLVWWSHMLGFRGHFSTKSRRYSTTLGERRRNRATFARRLAREARGLPVDEDEDTTLLVGDWDFAGVGYVTDGDALLAASIAAWTRESRDAAREAARHG
jgi:hypothetical protein